MMHGEEQANAFAHHNGSARMAERMAASGSGAIGTGSRAFDNQSGALTKAPASPSILTIVRSAEHADDMVGQQVRAAFALAERAEVIAIKLAGSYPVPVPPDSAGGCSIDGEVSGFAAMQSAVDGISRRAMSADPAFTRLSLALDQIERTLG